MGWNGRAKAIKTGGRWPYFAVHFTWITGGRCPPYGCFRHVNLVLTQLVKRRALPALRLFAPNKSGFNADG
jgi:hypothetical protein